MKICFLLVGSILIDFFKYCKKIDFIFFKYCKVSDYKMFVAILSKATTYQSGDNYTVKFSTTVSLLAIGSLKKKIYEFFNPKDNKISLKNYPLVVFYIKSSEKKIYTERVNCIKSDIKEYVLSKFSNNPNIFITGNGFIELSFTMSFSEEINKVFIKDVQNKLSLYISSIIMSKDKINKYLMDKDNKAFSYIRLADKYISRYITSNCVENTATWFYTWKCNYSKSSKDLELIKLYYSIEE